MAAVGEIELAIALSARSWSDRLHRFLADHGGARVRLTAVGPEDLVAEPFDVLLIDDICSFLTPRLIDRIRISGRQVVGVYDPTEFGDGKDRLLESGVADVIEAGAHPDEFVQVLSRVAATVSYETETGNPAPIAHHEPTGNRRSPPVLAVSGPPGGTGSTEVALALATSLQLRGRTVLVDGDDHAPSLAQRLGLPLHPNLRTAIDMLEHRTGPVTAALHEVPGGLQVMPGLPNVRDWTEVRPLQVLDVISQLQPSSDYLVVDVGCQVDTAAAANEPTRFRIARHLLEGSDRVIAVGAADPVGVARLIDWLSMVPRGDRPIDILLNRAPRDAYRRNELVAEIVRSFKPDSLQLLPDDRKVAISRWDGTVVTSGRFYRNVRKWADRFLADGVFA
jgi:MinD-like ATPase involved in chromosome partitioning or flagellar assembly